MIAEARHPRLESLLGHHYPASDIPQRARADMQELLMGDAGVAASVLLAAPEQIDHLQRRTMYSSACNPLQGYLYDKVYHELQR